MPYRRISSNSITNVACNPLPPDVFKLLSAKSSKYNATPDKPNYLEGVHLFMIKIVNVSWKLEFNPFGYYGAVVTWKFELNSVINLGAVIGKHFWEGTQCISIYVFWNFGSIRWAA